VLTLGLQNGKNLGFRPANFQGHIRTPAGHRPLINFRTKIPENRSRDVEKSVDGKQQSSLPLKRYAGDCSNH